ncbi:non-ribosomal peptide synthetase [Polymorphospora rubra]|uniref:Carrier domain-containing protein n=1 Tax=Polymorphospora rubra TaxID=338584 RepID=A0A810MZS0_9ACTN|nr:non-ribosomal peptide synthetase [Polymorphospora rubra]BCJ66656.1 hypothetical protein Prubr_36770 [Polymorphospora rubra]
MSNPEAGPKLSAAKAELLRRWRAGESVAGVPAAAEPTIPAFGTGPAPLSPAQHRLWFLDRLLPGSAAFNLSHCVALDGRLDPTALDAALTDLVERHDVLRTVVATVEGEARQVVRDDARPFAEWVDLTDLPADRARGQALERAREAADTPMDLATGPLARLVVYRLPDTDLMLLVVHHVIADGWALGVALRELSGHYRSRLAGSAPAAATPGPRFADFAAWQHDTAGDLSAEHDYWRDRLAGMRAPELPIDLPRPPEFGYAGDWRPVDLPEPVDRAVRDLARAQDATAYHVLLAALTVVLSRWTGQRDIVVGGAVTGRELGQTHGMLGNFTNTVALRNEVAGGATFRDLLASVRLNTLAALAHQRLPFDQVVADLNLPRSAAHAGPLPVTFVLQPGGPVRDFGGLAAEPIQLGWRTSRADLELHLWDQPTLHGGLVFRTDLFEAVTADRLAARLTAAVADLVAHPDLPLAEQPLLPPDERAELARWSAGPSRPAPAGTITELVAGQVRARPDATAVTGVGGTLDYAGLARTADRLAARLAAAGVRAETPVAVCLERGAGLVSAALGVLRAGGCYLPLDPAYRPGRLAATLDDAGATVLVCASTDEAARITAETGRELTVVVWPEPDPGAELAGPESDAGPDAPDTWEPPAVDPDALAYLIYTSGSTGRPKGVAVTHRSAVNYLVSLAEEHGFDERTVLGAIASPAFDASVAELFGPLSVGGTVHLVDAEDMVDGNRLADALRAGAVTTISGTATVWQLLRGATEPVHIDALVGGERVGDDLAHYLATTQRSAWTQYGPTEATVWVTVTRLDPDGPVSLGRPVRNVTCQLLDEDLQPVPIGAVGEVCVGGVAPARGYAGRPDLTADRFVPDPAGAPGARMYRTGDFARYRPDGTLQFAGRRDEQVKVRGFRIELGEIASVAERHPAVAQAAVTVFADPSTDDQLLVAYLVRRARPGDPDSDLVPTVRRHLRDALPAYMVPDRFVVLPELPVTGTGKVDLNALPAPAGNVRRTDTAYVAPRTALEIEITKDVEEFLEIDRVGLHDDFFELGGHSIRAAQLVVRMQDRYGVEIVMQKLFASPTVEHLATLISADIDRRKQLADEREGLRRMVGELSDDKLDGLLASLLAQQGQRPPAP